MKSWKTKTWFILTAFLVPNLGFGFGMIGTPIPQTYPGVTMYPSYPSGMVYPYPQQMVPIPQALPWWNQYSMTGQMAEYRNISNQAALYEPYQWRGAYNLYGAVVPPIGLPALVNSIEYNDKFGDVISSGAAY